MYCTNEESGDWSLGGGVSPRRPSADSGPSLRFTSDISPIMIFSKESVRDGCTDEGISATASVASGGEVKSLVLGKGSVSGEEEEEPTGAEDLKPAMPFLGMVARSRLKRRRLDGSLLLNCTMLSKSMT